MKKNLFILLLSSIGVFAQLTPGTIPVSIPPSPGFTSSLSNSPITITGATNVSIVGVLNSIGINTATNKALYSFVTNNLGVGGTINGIASNILQRISGLTSDAQGQINAKQNAFTTGIGITNNANTLSNNVTAGANITITAGVNGLLTIASTASGSGAPSGTVVSASTFSAGELLASLDTTGTNSRPSGLITNGVGGLNMNQANIGTIVVTNGLTNLLFVGGSESGITNTDLTASRLMFSDANKRPSSVAIGLGLTNNGSVLSNNIVAGSNVTITGGANGQLTIASTGGGGAGTVGTLINTASTTSGQLVQFSDTQKTNTTPVSTGLGITNNASILSNNIVAGNGITITSGANGQLTLATSGSGTNGVTLINTNFISGNLYTNTYGYPIFVLSPVAITEAAVVGNSTIQLQVPGATTNQLSASTLITSIAGSITNIVAASVASGGTYVFTNLSTGAGNGSSIPNGGQIFYVATGGTTGSSADVQLFTVGTNVWNKPSGSKIVHVIAIASGGSGGSGRRGPSLTAQGGGAGGSGGGTTLMVYTADDLPSTVAVSVGGGALGGAAVTIDNTSGNPGLNGTNTTFHTNCFAGGGGLGNGGTSATGGTASNGARINGTYAGNAAGAGSNGTAAGTAGTGGNNAIGLASGGGGGGGGIDADGVTQRAGGKGGDLSSSIGGINIGGGTAGGTPGGNGGNGSDSGSILPGAGGGGGGSRISGGSGGNGGNGGLYGGGGGGSGASINGVNSGAGGNGANGILRVTSYQ